MNQKLLVLVILVAVVLGVGGYLVFTQPPLSPTGPLQPSTPTTSTSSDVPTAWKFVDADSFTVSLPPGWTFTKLQGIDSYIGEFTGDGVKLMFDYGAYSNSLAEETDPAYHVTYEMIGGQKAKIVVPKEMGKGMVGVYFGSITNRDRLTVEGSDLSSIQQDMALKIFRTIAFKK